MIISILTLFPDMFVGPLDYSIIKRARKEKIVDFIVVNIRNFAADRYKTVDGRPYGGGVGMILRVDVVDRALKSAMRHPLERLRTSPPRIKRKKVLLDPKGTTYTQVHAKQLSCLDHLILVCGHYEGVDERMRSLVDEQISVGNYVLSGGEIPAMVVVDSIVRLLPGVLKSEATLSESFSFPQRTSRRRTPILEYPQYTRPPEYNGMYVPDVLLSGDHKAIDAWNKAHMNTKLA